MFEQIAKNKRNTKLLFLLFLGINFLLWYGILISFSLSLYLLLFVISYAFGLWFYSYYYGDKMILRALDAHKLTDNFNARLNRLTEEMSIAAGIPKPALYQINTTSLNACVVGRDPKSASLVVTMGLLQELDDEELRGVLAHEISHIRSYDILFHTILSSLIGVANLLNKIIKIFIGWDYSGGLGVFLIAAGFLMPVYLYFLAGLLPISFIRLLAGEILLLIFFFGLFFGGRIVQSIFSINRELLADSCAVELTRNPEGLIKAFQKMDRESNRIINSTSATSHLFLFEPLHGFYQPLFLQTHPPIKKRISQLQNITVVPTQLEEQAKKLKDGAACLYKSKKTLE